MNHPPRALLLCGGVSAEHDVSLSSAKSLLAGTSGFIDWDVRVIARDGRWLGAAASADRVASAGRPAIADRAPSPPAPVGPIRTDGSNPVEVDPAGTIDVAALRAAEVVFPLLHGPFGEDGRWQGALDVIGVPYVGCGVLGSAVGMDKIAMKAVLAAAGLPQVAYLGLTRHRWLTERGALAPALDALGSVVFVKPANLGSSIGIVRATDAAGRADAIDAAFSHDRRVIVEAAATGARELEVAVLGTDEPETSVVGEIRTDAPFYDFEAKYTPGGADLQVPAAIPDEIADACRSLARRAFLAIDGAGLARVDLFWRAESGDLWVNEINTMPGFTATSMFPRLWAASGVPYGDLTLRLLELARARA